MFGTELWTGKHPSIDVRMRSMYVLHRAPCHPPSVGWGCLQVFRFLSESWRNCAVQKTAFLPVIHVQESSTPTSSVLQKSTNTILRLGMWPCIFGRQRKRRPTDKGGRGVVEEITSIKYALCLTFFNCCYTSEPPVGKELYSFSGIIRNICSINLS